MAGARAFSLLPDEENQKPPGCSRTIDKMDWWSERKMAIHGLRPMRWSLPTVPSPSYMSGGASTTGSNFEQSLLLLPTATGAEVLKGNRRNVRVAGRLANARQSAAILPLFDLFLVFHVNFAIDGWARLLSWTDLSFEDTGRPDWTTINIAKSKFSMLKSIEMRHPEHPSCKVQLHPAEEQDIETTFTLEENEEFVGFQFLEAKQGAQNT